MPSLFFKGPVTFAKAVSNGFFNCVPVHESTPFEWQNEMSRFTTTCKKVYVHAAMVFEEDQTKTFLLFQK